LQTLSQLVWEQYTATVASRGFSYFAIKSQFSEHEMNKTIAVATLAAIIGFCVGHFCTPSVKAASASRVVHVTVSSDWEAISGYGLGTVAGISCPGPHDCYVALQGN